jgi:vitamin B12 transporter
MFVLPRSSAGAFRAEVLGFLREADDLIVLLSDDMFQIYQNVYAARSIGVEASSSWSAPREWLTLEANGTFQSFRNTSNEGSFVEFRGDRIPNRPWLFANVTARLKAMDAFSAGDELSLSAYARYVHSFFRGWESLGRREYKGYIAPTLALNYLIPVAGAKLSSTFEVDNVTDTDIQDYFGVQRPGRTVSAKLTLAY